MAHLFPIFHEADGEPDCSSWRTVDVEPHTPAISYGCWIVLKWNYKWRKLVFGQRFIGFSAVALASKYSSWGGGLTSSSHWHGGSLQSNIIWWCLNPLGLAFVQFGQRFLFCYFISVSKAKFCQSGFQTRGFSDSSKKWLDFLGPWGRISQCTPQCTL